MGGHRAWGACRAEERWGGAEFAAVGSQEAGRAAGPREAGQRLGRRLAGCTFQFPP